MEALILTVFVSVVLSTLAVLMFVWDVRQGGHDHHDRLSLLPLDGGASVTATDSNMTEKTEGNPT